MALNATAEHWDERYRTTPTESLSWYSPESVESLDLIDALGLGSSASVVDIGGGDSFLADHLLERGITDVTVLDVSEVALGRVRDRLGAAVTLVRADVTDWKPSRTWDLWHDRAAFHFLTDDVRRNAYTDALRKALAPGGHAIVATFALDGPTHCSGLPVVRYDATALADALGLPLLTSTQREHVTPAGVVQPFTWVVLGPV